MDFRFTEEQEKFRQEIRTFLDKECRYGKDVVQEDRWIAGESPEFAKKLAAKGWIGLAWPKKYGGQERGYLDRLVLTEELVLYGAPVATHWFEDRQIGASVLRHGSDALKEEFLPRLARAEIRFCLGLSDPEAGSDLAGVKTRAQLEGDWFIINGQKVWTSHAHHADYIWLVSRTDPNAPKHRGISEIIVDMKLPGITVRPLLDMSGDYHLNEVFFDNVRVSKRYLVGELNQGWKQIAGQLDFERSGIERLTSNRRLFLDILEYIKGTPLHNDPVIRNRAADLEAQFQVGKLIIYRVAWLLDQGTVPNYEAAMGKLWCTEYEQRVADWCTRVLGMFGQLAIGSPLGILGGRVARAYLYAPGYTLQAGTSEVLRTIVATRGLGLPAA